MRTARSFSVVLTLVVAFAAWLQAQPVPAVDVTLSAVERETMDRSPRYQAALLDAKAARAAAAAQEAQRYPRLVVEGSYRYNAIVPAITILTPRGPAAEKLGDNTNYSIGPAVYWTLWDRGALKESWLAAQSSAKAKEYEAGAVERQLQLAARNAYFQLALAGEQVVLYADSLQLAQRQYADIQTQVRAGAKSRMDQLSAHQEVLSRQQQLSQARADMAASLRDLAALTGATYCENVCVPVDRRISASLPADAAPPTLVVGTDPIDALLARFVPYQQAKVWAEHPRIEEFTALAAAAGHAANNAATGLWPKLQVMAKSSLDYPNGPTLEQINQRSFGATLTWPLFEWGASQNREQDSRSQAAAALQRKAQTASDFTRDWNKTMDQLANLEEQRRINTTAVAEAEELANITYRSYRSGSLTYIEVQNANFRVLQARIQLARTKVQMLLNLAVLASLAAPAQ